MPIATLERLHESVKSGNHSVDREDGVIRNVKILGRQSQNGRSYSQRALEDAANLYEGIKVNVDHPNRSTPDAERKFSDGFGELRNCKVCTSGVYGNLYFLKSHPKAEMVCESAERFPKQFGLSHNAEGELVQKDGGWVVESIECVHSVDIVSQPATNAGLFESVGRSHRGRTKRKTRLQIVKEAAQKMRRTGRVVRGITPLLEAMHSGILNPNAEIDVPDEVEASAEDALEAAMVSDADLLDLVSVPTKLEAMKKTIINQLAKKSVTGRQTAEEIQEINDAMDDFLAKLKRMFPTEFSDELQPPGDSGSFAVAESVDHFVSRIRRQRLHDPEDVSEYVARVRKPPRLTAAESRRERIRESRSVESEGRNWKPAKDAKEFASRLRKV